MFMRLLLYAGLGLLVGALAGGALQIAFNVLRYLIRPDWLAGGGGAILIALLGLLAATLLAGAFAYAVRRALGGVRVGWLFLGTAAGVLLDPYFLAEFGWTGPARMQPAARALALALPALGFLPILGTSKRKWRPYMALAALAVAAFAALPRFALVPALGGQLDLAAMSPIYLLVYIKGLVLLTGAAALSLILAERAERTLP